MKRLLFALLISASAMMASGCAMCCGTFDYDYPTYGGKWERGDRQWGRVGSNLSGAGAGEIGAVGEYTESGTIIQQPTGGVISGGSEVPIYPVESGTIIHSQ